MLDVRIVGHDEPIVPVRSFARGMADFDAMMRGLAANGDQAIAANARGCEGSVSPWASTRIYEIADDLVAVIKEIKLGSVHVVGHAAGGRYARMLATRHPDSVKTVVILSSGGTYKDKERFVTFTGAVMKTVGGEILPADMDAAMMASGAFAPGNDPSPWRSGWWPVAVAQAKGGEGVKSEEYAKAGGRPMLALDGKEDKVAPPQNSRALKDSLWTVTVGGVDNAAHNMLQEPPEAMVNAVDG